MKQLLLAAILFSVPLAGCDVNDRSDEKALQDLNVNAKYTVESVEVSGQKTGISAIPCAPKSTR